MNTRLTLQPGSLPTYGGPLCGPGPHGHASVPLQHDGDKGPSPIELTSPPQGNKTTQTHSPLSAQDLSLQPLDLQARLGMSRERTALVGLLVCLAALQGK